MTELGHTLHNLQVICNDTPEAMAERLGMNLTYFNDIIDGKRKAPKDFITRIVKIYELNPKQHKQLDYLLLKSYKEIVFRRDYVSAEFYHLLSQLKYIDENEGLPQEVVKELQSVVDKHTYKYLHK